MAIYTIIATVTKVENGEIQIKGVGKHLYFIDQSNQWNIFEVGTNDPHIAKTSTIITLNEKTSPIEQTLLVTAMENRKPLKFEIEEDSGKYKLKSVSVCDD